MNCETIILIAMIESSQKILDSKRIVTIVMPEFDYGVIERERECIETVNVISKMHSKS